MIRIATVQCLSIPDNASEACDAIVQRLRWADEEAIDLVVFPEAFLLGHSYSAATIRSRAREISGYALVELCECVVGFRAALVVGAFELVDGHFFNSAFVIEEGRIAGRYSKAHPNEPGVTAGSAFPTFVRSGIRFGLNICNDANHPEAPERIARQKAEVILYPLNNMLKPEAAERWRAKSLANLVGRARQTGCWIASSDVTGRSGDFLSFGCTAIVAPDGHVVARVPEMKEGVAVYDVPALQFQEPMFER
ncbi:carbon-nitrogen hydrolase family protein [Methylobacterium pseudosasicola]|uniref:Predicted amidohydrolase n=1 Tax=Methylobacterium pseudosasicola TaxID=582667 RepID=A0A1I4G6G7_9HYPH|nr:carbon-nitrogen hydrolase family protein [Methylobacterium pseudosasicola]SFL24701.1 Predicted amidohydrolase [Methylobacterium pseudosasicola]